MGDEIDAMTDNILSTLFSSRERRVRWKRNNKKKKGKRTLDTNFQRYFHLHFNADLITSNAIKEG